MKQFLTLTAILAMALPAVGAGYSENFDGGFQLGGAPGGWNWVADNSNFTATTVGTLPDQDLLLAAPMPPTGASFVAGYVGDTASYTDTVVSAMVNTNSPNPFNDQGLLCRMNDGLRIYVLNYDVNGGNMDLVYFNGSTGDEALLTNIDITPTDQIVNMKFNVLTADSEVYLVGQIWDETMTTMLGEDQFIVNGSQYIDDVLVPVLAGGPCGLYGIVESSNPGPLNTQMDDWAGRPGLHADFDLDGDVDVSDLGTLATYYGTLTDMMWSNGDANLDNAVNVNDLGILATNYGAVVTSATAVPEPGMLSLLGLGALVMLLRRRR